MPAPSPAQRLPRFVQLGRLETLDFPLVNADGTAASATAGTYSLRDAAGVEVVSGAVTIVAGVPTFGLVGTFGDAYQLPLPWAWRERWVLTGVSGTALECTYEQQVHVQRVAPSMMVSVGDLYGIQGTWRRLLPGSTIDPAEKVRIAWEEMLGRLLGDGHLPSQVLNWWALSTVHKYWAASLVCREFQTDAPDASRWAKLGDEYWERSQTEYEQHFKIQADSNDDGVADAPNVLEGADPPLYLTNVPASGWPWRDW